MRVRNCVSKMWTRLGLAGHNCVCAQRLRVTQSMTSARTGATKDKPSKNTKLSLHEFVASAPGALPLQACLPSRPGEK